MDMDPEHPVALSLLRLWTKAYRVQSRNDFQMEGEGLVETPLHDVL